MNFAGPAKRDLELEAAIRAGASISIESEGEARRAIAAAERVGIVPKVSVRVTPQFTIEHGRITLICTPSPFGVDSEKVPALVSALIEAGADWRGLHMFAGAHSLDADSLSQIHRLSLEHAGEIAEKLGEPVPELNLGSGFDVACRPSDKPLDVDQVANSLGNALCNTPPLLATTRFTIELGRWLVAECGVYLTRIVDRSESCGETFLATDGGGHHLINATGGLGERGTANYPIAIANRFAAPAQEQVTVTGCLCTPFDILGDEVLLPRADVGDLVAVFCAGAYGLTASPQAWESRPTAREMLV
jgi:diaminopimelate decarboxylase